ncbi:sigma-70 family RNA polymerase sigma factor [Paludicola sp. MB14-C6]|uniref:RNA polymerase sigma factor n=1 Tax=Paludihabitans sp. MB14-C6 TaxID=3070656 RepID=UPI0027DE6BCC|nr:sigma-70 family RNA polymerase sigma factor [Paludicola sp. MB14-C6]WMJ22406.1 sigma-70 family RNA polymerase sigma factor [Paludicola sp. MB14-C6]
MNHSYENQIWITTIIDTYSDTILRIAFHYVKNQNDAEDIVQNVFLKLISKVPVFENKEHEKAFIIRMTINLCKDYYKAAWHQKIVSLDDCNETFEDEHKTDLLPIIRQLPTNYKNVIYLYYYEDYSIEQIANILQSKPATIATWLHRARTKLKTLLKGEFEDEYEPIYKRT